MRDYNIDLEENKRITVVVSNYNKVQKAVYECTTYYVRRHGQKMGRHVPKLSIHLLGS